MVLFNSVHILDKSHLKVCSGIRKRNKCRSPSLQQIPKTFSEGYKRGEIASRGYPEGS